MIKNNINYVYYIKQVKFLFISLIIISILLPISIGSNALLLKILYDNIFQNFNEILLFKISILFFISLLFISIFRIIKKFLVISMKQSLIENMRISLTDELIRYKYQYFVDKNSGELSSCLLEDSEFIAEGFVKIFLGISNIIVVFIWLLIFFIFVKWMFIIYFLSIILIICWICIWMKPIEKNSQNYKLKIRKLYKFVYRVVFGIKNIKYELLDNHILNEMKHILQKINKYLFRNVVFYNLLHSLYDPIFYISNILFIFFGANEVYKGNFTIGIFTVILILLWNILEPIFEMNMVLLSNNELKAAFKRIKEYKTGSFENGGNISFNGINKEINFNNVYFKYPQNNFNLKNINLTIKKGQSIAVAGKTGSGKSTIINLLLRIFNPDKGNIYFDGRNIIDFTLKSIRENIIIVPQKVFLYPTTLKKNIDIKENLSNEEISCLLDKLCLTGFVSRLPKGIDTMINDNVTGISGGERQRIGIARALSLKSDIYIFDEVTANLDPKTAKKIFEYINCIPRVITKIFISHNIDIALHMDKIFVLSNNEIIELNNFENNIREKNILELIY